MLYHVHAGVCNIMCLTIITSYYAVLIGWVVNLFVSSWVDNAPWGDPELTGEVATNYFYNHIVGIDTLNSDMTPSRIVGVNVGYTVLI